MEIIVLYMVDTASCTFAHFDLRTNSIRFQVEFFLFYDDSIVKLDLMLHLVKWHYQIPENSFGHGRECTVYNSCQVLFWIHFPFFLFLEHGQKESLFSTVANKFKLPYLFLLMSFFKAELKLKGPL